MMAEGKTDGNGGSEPTGSDVPTIVQRFADVEVEHGTAQQDVQVNARARCEGAYRDAARALGDLQLETAKKYQDAHNRYMEELQDASTQGDRQRAEAAYREHAAALQTINEEAQQGYEEVNRNYSCAVEDAGVDASKESVEAYRAYLVALKESWGQVDVDAVVEAVGPVAEAKP